MKVCILIATYKGAKFIEAQLESLINQTVKPSCIFARDDNSDDGTRKILETYLPLVSLAGDGSRLGVCHNFFKLLQDAPASDVYMFCDQDDYWLPNKIERVVDYFKSSQSSEPTLYFTRAKITDENLSPVALSPLFSRIGFANALVQNVATGCTIAINAQARDIILKAKPLELEIYMHDWWCYLVVSCFGRVYFDPVPTILYRQHSANVEGVSKNLLTDIFRRLKKFRSDSRNNRRPSFMAVLFLKAYSDDPVLQLNLRLDSEKRSILSLLATANTKPLSRIKLLFSPLIFRQTWIEEFALRFAILIGKI